MKNIHKIWICLLVVMSIISGGCETEEDAKNSSTYIDPRDGSVYKIITIGNQVWMAENLKYLPSVVGSDTKSSTIPYYYVNGYEGTNISSAKAHVNYNTYGVLYNWTAACNACPPGWHLPTETEWTTLTTYLGGESVAGGKLKEKGTEYWNSPNSGATNETGFTALPGGVMAHRGGFGSIRENGYWWSSTENDTETANLRGISFYHVDVQICSSLKLMGYSVRCVKD